MEDENPPDNSERTSLRVGVVICCVLAAVAVSFLMPTFAGGGLAGTPLDGILPGDGAKTSAPPAGGFPGDSGSGLGALNPGDATGVGGEVGLDSETFANSDTDVHFTVETTERTYWRTGAFDTYTGSGWQRTGDTEPLDGSIEHDGPRGDQVDYAVTLNQTATAVPTAWRPAIVEGVEDPLVTEAGAVRTETPIESGTTIEGVSFGPEDDVEKLRSADDTVPEAVQEEYTQLPEDTPERIGDRTADLFDEADAEGKFEQAVAVQDWLRESKEYDLGASERGENIADTFIFEMDAGYCEYFATAMVTMLRSQDIPARYVVGYTTGQSIGNDTYEVRGMNAHAWVEVYFDDVGWVRFDPTPGNERLAAQEEALEDVDGEFNLSEPGSPGEEFEPSEPDEENTTEPGGISTSLNRSAVPGESVEVTVTLEAGVFPTNDSEESIIREDDRPIPGVEVLFNGDPVGITDEEGKTVGTVPDAEELEIRIREGEGSTPDSLSAILFGSELLELPGLNESYTRDFFNNETGSFDGGTAPGGGVSDTGETVTTAVQEDQDYRQDQTDDEEDDRLSDTHSIERSVTLYVPGEPGPGDSVTMTVSVANVVLEGATVTLDGEEIGETDENGKIEFTLPDRTGDVEISAQRGSLTGETTVTIPELSTTVETGPLGAHAFGSATVGVTLDDEPAAGVPVLIDGEEVGTTGTEGKATIDLPVSTAATITVERAGQTEQTTLSGLLYVPAAGAVLFAGVLAAVGYVLSVRDLRRAGAFVVALPRRLLTGGSLLLVSLVTNGDELLAALGARVRDGLTDIGGLFTGRTSPHELLNRAVGWASGVGRRLGGALPRTRSEAETESMTVQEGWRRFLDTVSVTTAATHTPGELAQHAIEEDGLPEEPVQTIRDTFREVEYGARSPSDRLEHIQEAIEQIEGERGER